MERLDRRDAELNTLFEQLGHAVTMLGEDVKSASRADEGAFMTALSRVAALRELRANLEAIVREVRRADAGAAGDRIAAMLARSSAQLDQVLSDLGSESAEREARSRAWRRLAERGAGLEAEIAGVRRRVGDRVAPAPPGE